MVSLTEILKVWKSAVWQTLCAIVSKIWPRNIICEPQREHIVFAYPTNFIANFEKNLHWLFEVTTLNVWQCEIGNCMKCFLPPCFSQLQKYRSEPLYDFQSIEASVLEVIKSRKLQHLRRSYKHEEFQKVKLKLDLIEQPYPDKIHSR